MQNVVFNGRKQSINDICLSSCRDAVDICFIEHDPFLVSSVISIILEFLVITVPIKF